MRAQSPAHLFVLGADYHLGDLLWFTAVVAEYRRQRRPGMLLVCCADRPISRILEACPLIDWVSYGDADGAIADARTRFGPRLILHDLRPLPIAIAMLRAWRRRAPWLYYRDFWLAPRGQWLATFLRLDPLTGVRPTLRLIDDDRATARSLPCPYVVLAPHVGRYPQPVLTALWHRLKGWNDAQWRALAEALRREGFEPVTLGAPGETAIPGTLPMLGLPIRQAAGVVERAAALVTVESGLWYVAAALGTPLVIVPWWLPRSVDWVAPMSVPYRLIPRAQASAEQVLAHCRALVAANSAPRPPGEASLIETVDRCGGMPWHRGDRLPA